MQKYKYRHDWQDASVGAYEAIKIEDGLKKQLLICQGELQIKEK